jgi:hypothetical protein
MIRKMIVIAAAAVMPATAIAGITAVGGAGVASAKALPPVAVTCSLSGTLTFAKPGLSYNGSLTNKASESTATAVTAGGAAACSTKAIKNKIPTATTQCWTTLPTIVGKVTTPGVLAPGAAPACGLASAKTAIKDQFWFDTTGGLLTGPAAILSALAGGVSTSDNGTKITLMPTAASAVVPGGACGAEVGFAISGGVTGGGVVTAFSMDICLGTDVGGTTGTFFTDYLAASGGAPEVISAAHVDPLTSKIVFS